MLARQIANLASLRVAHVARWSVGSAVGVEVTAGRGAVLTIDGAHVDVVGCKRKFSKAVEFSMAQRLKERRLTEWTSVSGQARDADLNVRAIAVWGTADMDGAADGGRVGIRQCGHVLNTLRVAGADWSLGGID